MVSMKEGGACPKKQVLSKIVGTYSIRPVSAHPESPERLAAIYEMLDNPLMSWKFTHIEPREATHKEIETIHSPSYVEFIASTARQRLCICLIPIR